MTRLSWLIVGLITCLAATVAADEPQDPEQTRRSRTVASVGQTKITVGDLEDAIQMRSPFARKHFEEPQALKELTDSRIEAALLAEGAERGGYGENPEVVRFVNEQMVQLFLRKEFDENEKPESVSELDVEAYYNSHLDEFRQPEMRRASHIVVSDKARAKEIIKEVAGADATKFNQLAKQDSLDDETKLRGGDLMFFTSDGKPIGGKDTPVDKTLVDAAFALKKTGDVVSTPVDLGNGRWSVVRLSAIRPGQERSLKDAAPSIRRRLWREQRKEGLEKLLADLEAEFKPVVHPELLDPIKLPPAPPGAKGPGPAGPH